MPHVIVVGAGLIGLTIARGLAREGVRVTLIGVSSPGEASPAAAGMLAPSVERSAGPAHDFAIASRDRFPEFLAELGEETGIEVPLNRLGILQVALSPAGVKGLKKSVLPGAEWITDSELHKLEPALNHGLGAVFSPGDGCVDNVELLLALRESVSRLPITHVSERVVSVHSVSPALHLHTDAANVFACDKLVIAAGAWSSRIGGIAFANHVRPFRGQMVSYDATPIRHVVYGPRGYLVPREKGHTLAGSTMENVGFESNTSPGGIAKIRSAAGEICPLLSGFLPARAWAGLRPVTPDLLPLLGADPSDPRFVYACGHSRNGVLLAPLTGETVTDLVVGRGVGFDLSQFRPDRFQY
ncbi:MAG: glycine oxidase ThiO [Gemmatimonadaceae bacterium]|nr:glycine oxidase ThiO [Gemmatimonadaceae bacterium]